MATRGFRIAALACTVALLAGCAATSAGPSPTGPAATAASGAPSPSSAPAGSSPVASAAGTWQAGRYALGPDSLSIVDLMPDGTVYLAENDIIRRDEYQVTGNQVSFTGESCDGVTGTYDWASDGGHLTMKVIEDPCTDRAKTFWGRLDRLKEQLPYLALTSSKVLDQPSYNQAAIDARGHVYTTDGYSGFYEYGPDGTLVRSWDDLTFTVGITVTADGTIYVSNFDDATVHAYSAAGKPVRSWAVGGGEIGPVGLAHDADGNVYVELHRTHDHYVEKYSPKGRLLGTWAPPGTLDGQVDGEAGLEWMAAAHDGTSYIGDWSNNRLVKFGPDGTFEANLTGDGTHQLVAPVVVAVDPKGNVFTLSMRTLWEFDSAGKVVGRWFTTYEGALVIDGSGTVSIVDTRIRTVHLPVP
jgi:hypothetical protein